MRVTANTFPNSLLQQLNSLNQRQNKLQNQAATGQRVQLPEDDPVAMRRVLDLQAEGKSVGQVLRTSSNAGPPIIVAISRRETRKRTARLF